MKIAFQGTKGSYSEEALYQYFNKEKVEPVEIALSEDVCLSLINNEVAMAILPIENSIVGNVAVNLDLLNQHETYIIGEFYLNVHHCLLVKPGVKLEDVKFAHSHPIALAQCRKFLKEHEIESLSALDTAGSAVKLEKLDQPDHAVIASSLCAEYYNLEILREKIQTVENNITRFVAFVKKDKIPSDIKKEKTSLSFSTNHEPGALLNCIQNFSNHKINLTKIESRPVPTDPFHYIFNVDFIGSCEDPEVIACLKEMKKDVQYINILGSYPLAKKN
jgi:prephenate dehydratase